MSKVKAYYNPLTGYELYNTDGRPIPVTSGIEIVDDLFSIGDSEIRTKGVPRATFSMEVEIVNEQPKMIPVSVNNSPDTAEDIVRLQHVHNTKENPWMMSNHDPAKWIMRFDEQQNIKVNPNYPHVGKTSDGYHTFDELYEHRIVLFLALARAICKNYPPNLPHDKKAYTPFWISRKHSDGSSMDGWFIAGLYTDPGLQITYHLPNSYWDECEKYAIIYSSAPQWDGHTSADVLKRLAEL